jgi:ribosomal protein L11 methyltransferase
MTVVARIELGEAGARRLAEAASEDAHLGWPSVALSEVTADRWAVEVYFAAEPDEGERAALRRLADGGGAFALVELPDTDWVAQSLAGLAPVRAGRFVVHGAHDRDKPQRNEIAIEIEAGEAFGTGHHGTTAGCLAAIDRIAGSRRIYRPLDIGTGSGVLAIAMAKRFHVPVLATDIDPIAVRVARANARLNGTPEVTAVVAGTLHGRVIRAAAPFDLIVANILAGPLQALAPAIARVLSGNGVVVLSGLLPGQKARIVVAYRTAGLVLKRASVLDGWLTLTLARS